MSHFQRASFPQMNAFRFGKLAVPLAAVFVSTISSKYEVWNKCRREKAVSVTVLELGQYCRDHLLAQAHIFNTFNSKHNWKAGNKCLWLSLPVTAIVPSAKDRLAMFYLSLAFEDTHIIIIMGGGGGGEKKRNSWDLCCVWIQWCGNVRLMIRVVCVRRLGEEYVCGCVWVCVWVWGGGLLQGFFLLW